MFRTCDHYVVVSLHNGSKLPNDCWNGVGQVFAQHRIVINHVLESICCHLQRWNHSINVAPHSQLDLHGCCLIDFL